ncbi:ubiquinone/menaquinone biosynthesis C-methyltransferase UbiE [Deltaproteobacteria bacterium]|nr:ubiquinone/menaquinone biosynthesis C-methyltransferase UbiE [Deltaproteobacteria bacterium]GHV00177.1 ubiquinone/menaquinone biosynthesis C-methyltransferase UbiE [Deltaproteobacteria bacterium]
MAGMFGRIARFYDLLNHILSLGIDRNWRTTLAVTALENGGSVTLDLAAGTLDVALALHRLHPEILVPALDFCPAMLGGGRRKLRRDNAVRILPVAADAKKLPLRADSADCITMAFGIRNILPREAAFAEMLRVLKPGGRACILEFGSGRERIWGGLYNFYLNRILPCAGRLISKDKAAYAYLTETIRAFPTARKFEEELLNAGFARAWYKKLTSGIVCLHVGEKE